MEKGQYPLLFHLRFVRCGVSYCGAVAPRVTAALLGRFLPRLGPLAFAGGPFFLRIFLRNPPPASADLIKQSGLPRGAHQPPTCAPNTASARACSWCGDLFPTARERRRRITWRPN